MTVPRTAGIIKKYHTLPKEIRDYFLHFESLINTYPPDIVISYMFAQIETAQNMMVYCGVVKLHRVEKTLAKNAVNRHHMTRDEFRNLYQSIFGKSISKAALEQAKEAEKIRDAILHGKAVTEEHKRKAIVSMLEYAQLLNEQVQNDAGFRPFGSMKGFKGRAEALDKSTSRWILMGMKLL